MTGDELRELQDRGRFFYERFPGAKAAEEWKRSREAAERKHIEASDSRVTSSDRGTNGVNLLSSEGTAPMPSRQAR